MATATLVLPVRTGSFRTPTAESTMTDISDRIDAPVLGTEPLVDSGTAPGRCPVNHGGTPAATPVASGATCPFTPSPSTRQRSAADQFVRRMLFVRERDARVSARAAESAFQKSLLISATRCTLTYVVFPFILPALGIVTSVGPALGIVIGAVALICDTFSIRRFFAADHRWRWPFTAVALCVMGLLTSLLVRDIIDLLS
jgi:hypothetical protein